MRPYVRKPMDTKGIVYITSRMKIQDGVPETVSITAVRKSDGYTHSFYGENSDVELRHDEKKLFNIIGGEVRTSREVLMEQLERFCKGEPISGQ